jgi:hypothetical protein
MTTFLDCFRSWGSETAPASTWYNLHDVEVNAEGSTLIAGAYCNKPLCYDAS